MVLPVFDDPEEDIARFFHETSRYIGRARRKGGVLVHCFAGQSRSVALVLAYLIQARLIYLGALPGTPCFLAVGDGTLWLLSCKPPLGACWPETEVGELLWWLLDLDAGQL